MSLINEALKKARQEAARQDRERAGPVLASAPRHVPPRPSRAPIAAAALCGIALVVAAAVFLWPRSAPPGEGPRTVLAPPTPAPIVAPAPSAEVTAPPPAAVEPAPLAAGPEAPADPATESEAASDPRELARVEAVGEGADPTPAAGSTPERTPPEPTPAGTLGGATFVKQATLPDGLTLDLQGIAWSDTRPVALINGRALSVGEGLGGCLIQYIDRDYVDLRRDDDSFRLRLR